MQNAQTRLSESVSDRRVAFQPTNFRTLLLINKSLWLLHINFLSKNTIEKNTFDVQLRKSLLLISREDDIRADPGVISNDIHLDLVHTP